MSKNHLTEIDIQLYSISKTEVPLEISQHLATCQDCQNRVKVYQLIFSEVEKLPIATFDFDVSNLVLSQISNPRKKLLWEDLIVYFLMGLAVLISGVSLYNLGGVFSGANSIGISLMILISLSIVIIFSVDFYKKYKNQEEILNFQAT